MTATKYEMFPAKQEGFLFSNRFKLLILIWYSVQNAVHILLMSYTRSRHVSEVYYPSVAVLFTELVKFAICMCMVLKDASFNPLRFLAMLKEQLFGHPRDTLKVCIPTLLYVFQNNILYVGASHLNATAFMITLQLKLVSAAIFSIILLKRRLNVVHWLALLILFVGVCIVQLQGAKHKHHTSAVGTQIPLLGFAATVAGCITSGFAGVFLEKILKDASPVSIWMRNVQMGLFAIPCCLATIAIKDGHKVLETRLLYGFDWIVWTQVFWLSIGGLTVSGCIKYADNITKDMATSIAIILATIGSVFLFKFLPSWMFGMGAAMVITGIFLYSYSVRAMARITAHFEQKKTDKPAVEEERPAKSTFKVFQLKKWGSKKGGDVVVPIEASVVPGGAAVVVPSSIEVFVVSNGLQEDKQSIIPAVTIELPRDLEKGVEMPASVVVEGKTLAILEEKEEVDSIESEETAVDEEEEQEAQHTRL